MSAGPVSDGGWGFSAEDESEARRLSRLLFDARELIEMWADVVERSTGDQYSHARRIAGDIDAYRAERGWSGDGFGGE